MKNPWMTAWLQAINTTLDSTQAFWAELMRWQTSATESGRSQGTEPALQPEAGSASAATPSARKPTADGETLPPAAKVSSEPTSPPRTDAEGSATAPKAAAAAKKKATATKSAQPKKKAAPKKTAARKKTAEGSVAASARTGAITPKFQHPANPDLTWMGRGRRPRWITDALETGRTLDDLRVREH